MHLFGVKPWQLGDFTRGELADMKASVDLWRKQMRKR